MRLKIRVPDITPFFSGSCLHRPQPYSASQNLNAFTKKRGLFHFVLTLPLNLQWKLQQWLIGTLLSLKRRVLVSKLLNTRAYAFNTWTKSCLRLSQVCSRIDLWLFLYFPYQNWVRKYIVVSLFTEARYKALALREWCWQKRKLNMACSLL